MCLLSSLFARLSRISPPFSIDSVALFFPTARKHANKKSGAFSLRTFPTSQFPIEISAICTLPDWCVPMFLKKWENFQPPLFGRGVPKWKAKSTPRSKKKSQTNKKLFASIYIYNRQLRNRKRGDRWETNRNPSVNTIFKVYHLIGEGRPLVS